MILCTLFSIPGITLQIIENQWCILAGRFVLGLSQGFFMATSGRLVEEFSPPHLYGFMMTILMFGQQCMVSLLIIVAGSGMPSEDDIEGLKTTEYWRFFLGFPLIFVVVALLMQFFILKHETPKYLLSINEDEKALASVKAAYDKNEDHWKIVQYLKQNSSFQTDKVSFKQALCDPRHCRPAYVLMAGITLLTMNGAQVFAFYGQVILNKMYQGGEVPKFITIDKVLNYNMIIHTVGQFSSIFFISLIGRRTGMMIYAFGLVFLNCLVSVFDLWNFNIVMVFCIMTMIYIQDALGVPVLGIYAVEVTSNTSLGII
jgi:MFS family permease